MHRDCPWTSLAVSHALQCKARYPFAGFGSFMSFRQGRAKLGKVGGRDQRR